MSEPNLERRNFMIRAIIGIVALIGAALSVTLGGFGILPAIRKRSAEWSDAGTADDLKAGEPQERRFNQTVKNGWQKDKVERSVWLVKQTDGSVTAFSPSCPHLGCGYRWFGGERRFKCPCHASVFDVSGKVLSGPAPRPLDVLSTKIESNRILVKFEVFQVGTSLKMAA